MTWLEQLRQPSASIFGESTAPLTALLLGLASAFTVLVFGLIIWMCWRYRAGSSASRGPFPFAKWKLEAAWIGIPLLLALGVFSWAAHLYIVAFSPPDGATTVYVLGKQWMWKVYHPEGAAEINELHVPLGTPVQLVLASQDVIHSFFVPAFRVKMDAVPGKFTTLWFTATRTGRFRIFCTQYCGTDHARMTGEVVVMNPGDFKGWLNGSPTAEASSLVTGERVFARLGCESCHQSGNTSVAPALSGLYGRPVDLRGGHTVLADDSYLRRSITDPALEVVDGYEARMPSFRGQLSEEELIALVTYLRSLGSAHTSANIPAGITGEKTSEGGA